MPLPYGLSSFLALTIIGLPLTVPYGLHYSAAHLLLDGSKTVPTSLDQTRRDIYFMP
jgi:hypothetical protein